MRRLRLSWRGRYPWWVWSLAGAAAVLVVAWLFQSRLTEPLDSYAECVAAGHPVLESYPPVCQADGRSFSGPVASSPSDTPSSMSTSQPFELLVEGDSRGTYPSRQEIITSAEQWRGYWRAVHSGLPSPPPLIPVDFTRDSVIAVSQGQQTSGGYGIKILSVTVGSAGSTIHVRQTEPDANCPVTPALTNPYYIVRTHHLPEPVSFRITPVRRSC